MRRSGYLPQPGMSAGAGVGAALGAFGQTMSNLGQLTLDDKEKKAKEALQNAQLSLAQNADKRGEAELKLHQDKLNAIKEQTQYERLQSAIKAKNMASAFRAAHPNATKHLSDDELIAWGNDIDKLLPKDKKIDKLDTRITPEGNKILTYMQDGQIVEKNMGKVKTDWNEGKKSSDIPEGWVSVGTEFHKDYGHEGNTKLTKDGRYIAPLPYVNKKFSEQSDGNLKLLDEEL